MSPNLFIIAGPNGAGKSMFSNILAETDFEVFDGDKYIALLKEKYPETGSDILLEQVNEVQFRDAKDNAIKQGKSFAFETNFSASDPTKSLREFKAAGYRTHLVFMGMNSIEECMQRVSQRVKDGGHMVLEDSIIYNFKNGFANLYTHYHEFDTVTLVDNSIATDDVAKIPSKLLTWEDGNIKVYESEFPSWVKRFIDKVNN